MRALTVNSRRVAKWLLYAAAAALLLLLVLIVAVKVALNRVPEYQAQLKSWVHQQTGLHIRFSAVTPALRWYGPELRFDGLELRSGDDRMSLAQARSGSVAVDVWSLLANARLLAGRIRLDSPQLTITRLGPDRFSIGSGVEFGGGHGDLRYTLRRLPSGRLDIRNARLTLLRWNDTSPTLRFDSVGLALTRSGGRVDLGLDTTMPSQLSGTIRLRLNVADFTGDDAMSWRADLRAREVSLPGWHDLLPEYSNSVQSGIARVDLDASGTGADAFKIKLDLLARDFRADGKARPLREVGGVFDLSRSADRWSFSGRRVRTAAAQGAAPETRFHAEWRSPAGVLASLRGQFDHLSIDALAPVVAVLPQKSLRERIAAYDLSGDFSDAQLSFDAAASAATARWSVRARFNRAGFAPLGHAPGFKGLSGSFEGNERSGSLALDAPGTRVAWPEQWPAPVPFDTLRATVYWKREAGSLLVASKNLELGNQDLKLSAKFAWSDPGTGSSPELTVASVVRDVDASSAPRYLPRQKLAPSALAWLDRAFVAGRVPQADVVFQGPVRNFPFRDGSGLFLVRFPGEHFVLDYREGWPRIEDVSLDAEFRNQGLSVTVRQARAGDVQVQAGHAEFIDFKTGELSVHAESRTNADAAVKFLAATPLDALAGNAFSKVDGAGPLQASVDLFLPFKQFDQRRVLVEAQLQGVSLAYKGSKAAATQLQGSVSVDGAQVPRAQLRGQALGGPLQVRARPPRNRADLATQLELRGTLTAEGLRAAFDLPAPVTIDGHADWRGTVRLAPAPARDRWVRVHSTLEGLELRLPEPFAKNAAAAWQASAQVDWLKGPGPVMNISLAPLGHALIQWDAANRLDRAAAQFGGESAVLGGGDRLVIGGTVPRLDLSGWLAWRSAIAAGSPAAGATALSDWLQSASLTVGELDFHALAFHQVQLALSSAGEAWEVQVGGPNAQGTLSFPRGESANPWNFAFSRLKIEDRVPAETQADPSSAGSAAAAPAQPPAESAVSPRAVPALRFDVGQLTWGSQLIGAVDATLSRVDDGVVLDQAKIKSESFNLEATGAWRGEGAGRGTLEGVLVSNDVQRTLAQFGYADVVQGKAGRLEFDLDWAGIPSQSALGSLGGQIKLEATKGQIVDLNPGAGRVLGLASVATLPRRLFLDFSDLTDKGFAYDSIRGDFDLRNGDAYTTNFLLDGPAAEIGLVGRVGLAKRDIDQTAVVAGNFGNSLPLASTLAAGPVVGAAVLVFSQVFKQPLKGLARGYYRITGSWENPLIERVKSDEAAAATKREPAAQQH